MKTHLMRYSKKTIYHFTDKRNIPEIQNKDVYCQERL